MALNSNKIGFKKIISLGKKISAKKRKAFEEGVGLAIASSRNRLNFGELVAEIDDPGAIARYWSLLHTSSVTPSVKYPGSFECNEYSIRSPEEEEDFHLW